MILALNWIQSAELLRDTTENGIQLNKSFKVRKSTVKPENHCFDVIGEWKKLCCSSRDSSRPGAIVYLAGIVIAQIF